MNTEILYLAIMIVVSLSIFAMFRLFIDKKRLGRLQLNNGESIIDIVLGADAGDPNCMEKLARCYKKGHGVPRSVTYAKELTVKARKMRKSG